MEICGITMELFRKLTNVFIRSNGLIHLITWCGCPRKKEAILECLSYPFQCHTQYIYRVVVYMNDYLNLYSYHIQLNNFDQRVTQKTFGEEILMRATQPTTPLELFSKFILESQVIC